MVIPGSKTACWSKYPTLTFLFHSTLPSSGINLPVTMFINVDFPSPFAPTNPICSPFNNLKDTLLKIALSPKPWLKFVTFNIILLFPFPVIRLILKMTSSFWFSP